MHFVFLTFNFALRERFIYFWQSFQGRLLDETLAEGRERLELNSLP